MKQLIPIAGWLGGEQPDEAIHLLLGALRGGIPLSKTERSEGKQ